jgi:hypothetical protein
LEGRSILRGIINQVLLKLQAQSYKNTNNMSEWEIFLLEVEVTLSFVLKHFGVTMSQ